MEKNIEQGLLSHSVVYCTALYLAAQHGHRDVVKYISELPIEPVASDLFEFSTIYLAAKNGNLDMFKHAMENAFNIEMKNKNEHVFDNGVNNVKKSVESNKIERNSLPVETKMPIDENETNLVSCTIFEATEVGSENQLRLLIESGINVNEENENGYTAVQIAAKNGNVGCVEILLESGADLSYKTNVMLCDEANRGKTALHLACGNGHFEVVSKLLYYGDDIEAKDYNKKNVPLYYAARSGSVRIVQLLLDKGANINATNDEGDLVITEARNKNVISLLLKKGLDYRKTNKHRESILHQATFFDNYVLIDFLLKHKFNVNIEKKDSYGNSPLVYAANLDKRNAMKVLLKHGANIQSSNNFGGNALHVAVWRSFNVAVTILLKHRININSLTLGSKQTPLIVATIFNNIEAMKLLLSHRANLEIRDFYNMTALEHATEKKNSDMVHILNNPINYVGNIQL